MKRIIWHWTAGRYTASDYEKTRYHFLIEEDGSEVEGDKPPEANKGPLGPDYVRHAGGFNTDSIGVAVCAMGGAQERPFHKGQYPVTREQIDGLVRVTADLCEIYNITPGRYTTMCHSEVRPRFGAGVYKWDVNYLPAFPRLIEPEAAGDYLRGRVQQELANRRPAPKTGGLWAFLRRWL